jgi:shikimate dehydrogenase
MRSAPTPDRYAVIGHPIAHSLSPQIHAAFARATGQVLTYDTIDATVEQLAPSVQRFFAAGGCGLNVTVPHKQAALTLSDTLSERATTAGAVNTLRREPDGRLHGDNTDGVGLVRDLTTNLNCALEGRRLLLLGAGGAARGVLAPLLALRPRLLVIANRTAARAQALAARFAPLGPVVGMGLEELDDSAFDLILNATAASLAGELPPLPSGALATASVCYDLAYGRNSTPFVRWARSSGCQHAHSGLGMLVEQAAESFYLWRGVRPQTAPVLAALASA